MSGEAEGRRPTDREVTDWFRENFGSAVFPTNSRIEWVREHWAEMWCPEKAPNEEMELAKPKERELPEKLCPDLLRLFDGSFGGLFETSGRRPLGRPANCAKRCSVLYEAGSPGYWL